MSDTAVRRKRVNQEPWTKLPTARKRHIMRDLADTLPCYSQARDGWYTPSCYEAKARPACVNCLILKRLHKVLAGAGDE